MLSVVNNFNLLIGKKIIYNSIESKNKLIREKNNKILEKMNQDHNERKEIINLILSSQIRQRTKT